MLTDLRSTITRRVGINESNRQEKFKKLMRAQISQNDINFVYRTIHEMYTKRQADELGANTHQ